MKFLRRTALMIRICSGHLIFKEKGRRAYIREVFAGISMGQNTREDVKVTAKDKFVTLSTCTSDQADGRYLVQAVLRKKKTRR